MSKRDDFYEEDEPVADVVEAFESGTPVATGRDPDLALPVTATSAPRIWAAQRREARVLDVALDACRAALVDAPTHELAERLNVLDPGDLARVTSAVYQVGYVAAFIRAERLRATSDAP